MDFPDREKNAFLALLNGQAGRYETTKRFIKKTIENGVEPSDEEQKLLSIAYSKLQHTLRDSWRVMSAIEKDERANNGKHVELIEEARKGVEAELEGLCDEVIDLVKNKISPSATTDETRLFCLKMEGDYNRYIAECTCDEKRAVRTEMASTAYGDAVKLAQDRFDAGKSFRMSIMVNAAVFYHDFMSMQSHAIELTESELDKAENVVEDAADEDVKTIMGILRANLQLWKADKSD